MAPQSDDKLFPRWERLLKIGWIVAGLVAIGVGYTFYRGQTARPPTRYFQPAMPLTTDGGVAINPAVSASGKLLAYACDATGEGPLAICVRPLAGGQSERLTRSTAEETDPDISPDDATVVFRSEQDGGGVYTAPSGGGGVARRIAAGGLRPRYSPDGMSIAYYDERGRIFVVAPGGGAPRQIEPGFSTARYPVWSQDGQHLLFEGTTQGVTDWWVTTIARPGAIRTHALEAIGRVTKSHGAPDRWTQGRVLFTAAEKNVSHAWALALSETSREAIGAPEPLTDGVDHEESVAAGPYGRLVFPRVRQSVDVWSLLLDPESGRAVGNAQPLTEAAAAALPAVSSDGRRLIYASNKSGFRDLWLNEPGRGAERALTDLRPAGSRPVLSRDGTQVVYADDKCNVILAAVNGGSKKLPGCFTVWDWPRDNAMAATFDPHTVEIVDPATMERRRIVSDPGGLIIDARLSPDGSWIAYVADSRLQIAQAGGERIEIASPAGSPAWSPDGQLLYFRSTRDGFHCLWGQKLDAARHPAGPPIPVQHFHGAALGIRLLDPADFRMSVGGGRLFFNLAKTSSELWMTTGQ